MCIYIRFIVLIFKETTRTTSGMGKKKIKKSLRAKRVRNCHTWTELADDLIISIMSRLTTLEILTSAQVVCKVWFNICKNPLMWSTIDMRGDDLYSLGKNVQFEENVSTRGAAVVIWSRSSSTTSTTLIGMSVLHVYILLSL